ncbi:tetratricopeptide repeat protein [uncultured Alistipes sp.]|uniref:tetratricopeptide repeat protein n=1 Tax=uncultured Alistipes sp. TaxID=538949 RepID=UPI0025DF5923|nr:tetratricopeptide repeat protein [uncultured Alistipes sp.]
MYRLFPYILLLFVAAEAGAQQLPERGLVRRGNRSYARGDYARAIERYERALKAAPGSFEATYDLGNALCRAERFDQSEQTLARAAADTLRTDDERAEAFYNLGNAQFSQQKYKEALESYKQSLRLAPADMEAKYNYAYTKKLLEDQQQNGGGNDDQQDQDQNQDRQGDGQNAPQQGDPDKQDRQGEEPRQPEQGEGKPQQGEGQSRPSGLSEQEQQQMLDAIQAQEDRTQEKLKEKQGVVVRGKKNW